MFLRQTAKEIVGQPKGLRGSSGRGNRVIGGQDFDWTFDPIFGSTPGAQSVSSSSAYAGVELRWVCLVSRHDTSWGPDHPSFLLSGHLFKGVATRLCAL